MVTEAGRTSMGGWRFSETAGKASEPGSASELIGKASKTVGWVAKATRPQRELRKPRR